jgi:uncharacterized membrane protein YhaH (DUF805 family)
MLGFLFGFNARLGRLHFLISMIVVTVLMVAIYFAVIAYVFQTTPKGTMPSPTSGPFVAAAVFYGWLTITLQSMRIRDIGWDPVCVMPAWIAAAIVDGLVAAKFPAISLANEHGTIVGALINVSLILALLFCPGGAQDDSSPRYDELFRTPDGPPPPSPVAAPPAPPQTARVANAGFGRRGL